MNRQKTYLVTALVILFASLTAYALAATTTVFRAEGDSILTGDVTINGDLNVTGTITTTNIYVPYNAKIADINEVDTNLHTLDLATALSESRNITAVIISHTRIAGTGNLQVYPNEGSRYLNVDWASAGTTVVLAAGTNRLQYKQSVANDDFDLYCLGYIVTT